jgi:hypothetical protein
MTGRLHPKFMSPVGPSTQDPVSLLKIASGPEIRRWRENHRMTRADARGPARSIWSPKDWRVPPLDHTPREILKGGWPFACDLLR